MLIVEISLAFRNCGAWHQLTHVNAVLSLLVALAKPFLSEYAGNHN